MKTRSKALLLSLCAVLLVASTVFGTLAYLTDTESAKNTFTVGHIDIKLDEAKVNKMGDPMKGEETVEKLEDADRLVADEGTSVGNAYHLLPGHEYTKDPTVTVKAGSENSYVRMIVTATFKEDLSDANLATKLDGIFTGYGAAAWNRVEKTVSDDKKTITYEYHYKETVDGFNAEGEEEDAKLEPLFTAIKVPEELTNETLAVFAGMEINIVAHAIQADGFTTAADAWAKFPTTTPAP